jgi:hypothetical protein
MRTRAIGSVSVTARNIVNPVNAQCAEEGWFRPRAAGKRTSTPLYEGARGTAPGIQLLQQPAALDGLHGLGADVHDLVADFCNTNQK